MKNWKFSSGNIKERKLRSEYQFCYQELLNKTSKEYAPWFVVPADDKPTARLIVAEIIKNITLKNLSYQQIIKKNLKMSSLIFC